MNLSLFQNLFLNQVRRKTHDARELVATVGCRHLYPNVGFQVWIHRPERVDHCSAQVGSTRIPVALYPHIVRDFPTKRYSRACVVANKSRCVIRPPRTRAHCEILDRRELHVCHGDSKEVL